MGKDILFHIINDDKDNEYECNGISLIFPLFFDYLKEEVAS